MSDPLHVMAIVDEAPTMALMQAVFEGSGDDLVVATDLAEGLARAAAEVPEVVFIDVALGNGAGLALVHHIRTVSPTVSIYALAKQDTPELGSKVMALGGAGVLTFPITGDELLTAAGEVRRRLGEARERRRLFDEAQLVRQGAALVQRLAEAADAPSRSEAALRVAEVFSEATSATSALLYVPAGEGSTQLVRSATLGDPASAPAFCEEMDLHQHARAAGLDVVPLALKRQTSGLVALAGARRALEEAPALVELLASQAATALALAQERERSNRGAMKDPGSSAYTFAYFVDVAGREIDKARRHGRRFALATIAFDHDAQAEASHVVDAGWGSGAQDVGSLEMAERLLDAVRDTDVLARVDQNEFYLLLPETGGTGAHTLRRRVLRHAPRTDGRRGGRDGVDLVMGCATFPHDGVDLSRLLRAAKQRAEAQQRSAVRRYRLDELPLTEILDVLLLRAGDAEKNGFGLEAPRRIELPLMDFIALGVAAAAEAVRTGSARLVATERGGMSLGAALRAQLDDDGDRVRIHTVDLSRHPDLGGVEALTIVCEVGAVALLASTEGSLTRAVHAADPLLTDLVTQRLGEASGERLFD